MQNDMHQPTFTIGIAFYNPGKDFRLALQSVFAQTFTDWELLLVDDKSTDGSVEFVNTLRDSRVRVLVDGDHRNLNVRLNQMVSLARGRYFVRMDADDIMHPERLERQLSVLQREGDAAVIGSAAYSIDEHSRVIGIRPAPLAKIRKGFAARHSFVHPTVAASVQWFRDNPYSESFVFHRSQDAELWCRTSAHTRFVVMPEPLLFYREMGNKFSFANYLGTSLGVLYLATVHSGSRPRAFATLSRELCKVWLTCLSVSFGKERWLIRQRFRKLPEKEHRKAERVLASIVDRTPSVTITAAGSLAEMPEIAQSL